MAQHILITGASAGIGRALTLALAREGHTVYAVARNEALLLSLQKEYPTHIQMIAADIATPEGRESVKTVLVNVKLSHLVNNAGLMAPSGLLENVDLAPWRYQMAVNVEAPLFLTQSLLPQLKGGRILNVSIYSSFKVLVGLGAYGTSKAALNMLTEYLKVDLSRMTLQSDWYCQELWTRISKNNYLHRIVPLSLSGTKREKQQALY